MPGPGEEQIRAVTLAEEFLPNPLEAARPTNGWEALQDSVRFLDGTMPRAELVKLMEEAHPGKIMQYVQGNKPKNYELNAVELHMGQTVSWCVLEGFLDSPITSILLMAGVRQAVLEGGTFLGKEDPVKILTAPAE